MVEAPRIRILYENINFTTGSIITNAYGPSYVKHGINLKGYILKKWWYAGKYIYLLLTKKNKHRYVVRTHTMMYGKIIVVDSTVSPTESKISTKLKPFMVFELDNQLLLKWYLTQIKILDPLCSTDLIKTNYAECSSRQNIEHSFEMMRYDISNEKFNRRKLLIHINKNYDLIKNDIMVDFLLNQHFFPGIGNILQQEALYRCRILPTRTVSNINMVNINCLIDNLSNVINLLYQSYINKKTNLSTKPIFQIYHKSYCPLGHKTITKYLGERNRRTT